MHSQFPMPPSLNSWIIKDRRQQRKLRINLGLKILTWIQFWPVTYIQKVILPWCNRCIGNKKYIIFDNTSAEGKFRSQVKWQVINYSIHPEQVTSTAKRTVFFSLCQFRNKNLKQLRLAHGLSSVLLKFYNLNTCS